MLVKITELNNIGSNISYTTLIPVVDTAGTATTEKANLQIVGNLILNGAGGSNFPRAAQANIALSVANAAQPNITSVGNLTSLNVIGTVTANNFIGNIEGNITNAVFATTAGTVVTNAQPNITSVGTLLDLSVTGNVNVASNINTTANVYANWIIGDYISGNANPLYHIPTGNLTGVDGNTSNVLRGDGSFGTFTGVQGIQGIQGLGSQGIQGTIGSQGIIGIQGVIGSQGIQGTQGTQGIQGATGIQGILGTQGIQGTIGSQGLQGIQSIQGLQGTLGFQGLQGISGAGSLPLANGNSNFNIATVDGNATITANSVFTWSLDINGNLSLPGNILSNNTIFIDTRDNSNVADIDLYSGDDILLQGGIRTTTDQPEGGDINIFAGSGGPGSGGESSGGGDIQLIAGKGGDAGDTDLGSFGGSISLQAGHGGDADVGNLQVAGGGGSLTIEAGDAGINGGNTSLGRQGGELNLYAGNTTEEAQNGASINIEPGHGGANGLAGYVAINIPASDTGPGGSWYFDGTGNSMTVPQNGVIFAPSAGNITLGAAGNTFLQSTDYSNLITYTFKFNSDGTMTLPNSAYNYAQLYTNSANLYLGNSGNPINIQTDGSISGNGNISITGNVSANNFTGNTNGYTLGYLDIPQIAASNTTLAATDGGKHYYSTTAGNLTLTIPNNATTSFQTGTAISIVVQATGNVLVNAASGVTLYMAGSSSAGNRAVGAYGMATLMKVASDTWFINGTGVY